MAMNMGTAGRRKSTIRNQEKQSKRLAAARRGFTEAVELLGITHLLEQFPHRLRQELWNLPVGEPVVQAGGAPAPRQYYGHGVQAPFDADGFNFAF